MSVSRIEGVLRSRESSVNPGSINPKAELRYSDDRVSKQKSKINRHHQNSRWESRRDFLSKSGREPRSSHAERSQRLSTGRREWRQSEYAKGRVVPTADKVDAVATNRGKEVSHHRSDLSKPRRVYRASNRVSEQARRENRRHFDIKSGREPRSSLAKRSQYLNNRRSESRQSTFASRRTATKVNAVAQNCIRLNRSICTYHSARNFIDCFEENCSEFDKVNIATWLHRSAKLNWNERKCIVEFIQKNSGRINSEIQRHISKFNPQHIANILWAFGKLGIKDENLFALFARELNGRDLRGFKPQHIANTLWAFGTLGIKDESLFALFAAIVKSRGLRGFKPQEISNIAWAFGKLEIKDEGLFALFARELKNEGVRDFNSQGISNTLWAFGKLGIKDEGLFSLFAIELKSRGLRALTQQNIANIAWAFGKLGIKDEGLFSLFAREVKSRDLRDFNSQHIANTLWAFGKLGIKDESLFALFAAIVKSRGLRGFTSQSIASIAWAFGKLGIKDKGLFSLFAREVKSRDLRDFNPQGIANIVWAFGKLEIKDEGLFSLFAREVKSRDLRDFNPQGIANITWAFGTLEIKDEGLFSLFVAEVKSRGLRGFTSQGIANIAWAFGKLEMKDESLFALFAVEVKSRGLRGFTSQNIANILWAFGKLRIKDEGLFNLVVVEVKRRGLRGFTSQNIANILWAFAACQVCFGLPMESQKFVKNLATEFFNNFSLLSYQQIQVLLQVSYIFKLPDMIRKLEPKYPKFRDSADITISRSQKEVKNVLLSAGVFLKKSQIKEEYQLLIGLTSDLYIRGLNLVIEFDGPTHFNEKRDEFGNKTYNNTVRTDLRNYLITKVACANLMVVPFHKWDRLDLRERKEYLKGRIDEFLNAYTRTPDDV